MKLFVYRVCDVLLLLFCVTICSANNSDGFLDASCNQASDCIVLDTVDQRLRLDCSYTVNKCKCEIPIATDFNVKWENGQCLMSKNGPCSAKEPLAVGCQDGFVCVDNQCRDPVAVKSVKVTPYLFTESNCATACKFGDFRLGCNFKSYQCECTQVFIADGRNVYWDVKNYDGANNCSVGKFGPCGTQNGMTLGCHGDGIACVDGTCLNANRLISEEGEDCVSQRHCKRGLLCSDFNVCIQPFSSPEGKSCAVDMECQNGLYCKLEFFSELSYSYCANNSTEISNA